LLKLIVKIKNSDLYIYIIIKYMKIKLLLFGLNYKNTNHELNGCINDTLLMKNCLEKYLEIDQNEILLLTDDTDIKPTKNNIINSINQSIEEVNNGKYDTLWVHYSGHGTYIKDTNNDENKENDGNIAKDEALYTLDDDIIIDDELNEIFSKLNSNKKLICIFDCCHSGTALDLPFKYNYMKNQFLNDSKLNKIKCNAVLLSGCKDTQYSEDVYKISDKYDYNGAFTVAFIKSCQASYTVSLKTIIKNAFKFLKNNNFKQIPQLSCNFKSDINQPFLVSKKRKFVIEKIKKIKYIISIFQFYYSINKNSIYMNYINKLKNLLNKFTIV